MRLLRFLSRLLHARQADAGPTLTPPVQRFEKLTAEDYDLHLARLAKRRQAAEELRRQSARVAMGQDRRGVVLPMRRQS